MKARTVNVLVELRNCARSIRDVKDSVWGALNIDTYGDEEVAQVSVSVAQPSAGTPKVGTKKKSKKGK